LGIIIHWNGFFQHAWIKYPKEVCGFLFTNKPYSEDEEWYVYKVKNVSKDPTMSWIPDRTQMLKVKQFATKKKLTKLGNIHSHCVMHSLQIEINQQSKPSDTDLKYARKFNDIVRGIIVVNAKQLLNVIFHDKYGKKIDIDWIDSDAHIEREA